MNLCMYTYVVLVKYKQFMSSFALDTSSIVFQFSIITKGYINFCSKKNKNKNIRTSKQGNTVRYLTPGLVPASSFVLSEYTFARMVPRGKITELCTYYINV